MYRKKLLILLLIIVVVCTSIIFLKQPDCDNDRKVDGEYALVRSDGKLSQFILLKFNSEDNFFFFGFPKFYSSHRIEGEYMIDNDIVIAREYAIKYTRFESSDKDSFLYDGHKTYYFMIKNNKLIFVEDRSDELVIDSYIVKDGDVFRRIEE